ncbi:MAG: restriction endonuclease subunit S [Nigerium sp.]|nr:restriction endonuclease subunit S [Nigerium sp.]
MTSGFFSLPRVNRASDGWSSRSLRSMLVARSERNRADLPLLTVARERGVFVRSVDDANHNTIPEDLSNYKVAHAGDLVINKMKAWQGSLGLAPVDGIVSPAYFVFAADFAVPRFGEYLLRSRPYVAKFGAASDGVRIGQWDLNIPRMRNIEVLLPPTEEQAAIVRYLAHANARIDKAIAAKRRLIALLEEQQRVRVRSLLTGSVWPLWPLGRLGRMGNGSTPSRSNPAYWDGDTPWLNSSVVNLGVVDSADQFVTAAALTECHLPIVEPESVLVGITGQGKTRGMSAVLRIRATINQHLAFITPRAGRMRADFLHLALTAGYDELRRISDGNGGTKGALTIADLKAFKVPLPTLDEQRRLVMDVSESAAETVLAVEKTRREIALLQEFRTRLVADVVTGQLDVRAIAATLRDVPECESRDLDDSIHTVESDNREEELADE